MLHRISSFRTRTLVTIALAAFGSGGHLSSQEAPGLYDPRILRTLDFRFESPEWHAALASAYHDRSYVKATLVVDGKEYRGVGVRFRGASSFRRVGRKKSIKVAIDAFEQGQELFGYTTLNLSNGFNDPTFCREVLTYDLLRRYMPAPRANHVRVMINGEYFGLFVNVQQIDRRFLTEWYGAAGRGNLYRCDATCIEGSKNTALQWLGSELLPYSQAYEVRGRARRPWRDIRDLCNVLNHVAPGALSRELPRVLDVDQALWYVAANMALVNLDSYVERGNDYFLYHDPAEQRFDVLPWDMNESFGGFGAGLSVEKRIELDPFYGDGRRDRPLLGRLLRLVPEWRARYLHHLRTIVVDELDWAKVGPRVAAIQARIAAAVREDPNRLYPFELFERNVTETVGLEQGGGRIEVPGLAGFCRGRTQFLSGWCGRESVSLSGLTHVETVEAGRDLPIAVRVHGGARSVTLGYGVEGAWYRRAMHDDGAHGDGGAGDGVFGASIPATANRRGAVVRYYVSAEGSNGAVTMLPRRAAFAARSYTVLSDVRIQRLVARNETLGRDEAGEAEDWIELANATDARVDVSGMFLTDDVRHPQRWRIPAGTAIEPQGRLCIWCDDEPEDGPLHATFRLAARGDAVFLVARDGRTVLDSIEFGELPRDHAVGRLPAFPDGPVVVFPAPSLPGVAPGPGSAYRFWAGGGASNRLQLRIGGGLQVGSRDARIELTGAPPRATAVLFCAAVPGAFEVAGARVFLGAPVVGPFRLPVDAQGRCRLVVPIADDAGLRGAVLFVQAFAGDAGRVLPSNGVRVELR